MGFASRVCCGPLVLALILAGAAPRDASPAAAIADAAGHPSRLHLRMSATRVRDNRTVIESVDVAGVNRLVRRCRADLCSGTWFDGTQLFEFGINGTPFVQVQPNIAVLRTYATIISTAFAEADFTGSVLPLPVSGGHERFRVSVPGGVPLVAVADAKTHVLERIEQPDGSVMGTLSSNRIGAVTLYSDRTFQSESQVDEPLRAPTGPATVIRGESDLSVSSQQLPIVPCTVDGTHANCLIDTGSTPSAMTLDFAEKLGREPHGEMELSAFSRYVTGVIDIADLTLGGTTIKQLRTAVIPKSRDINFDVIVGSDALAGMRVVFDPANNRVHIGASSPAAAGTGIALYFDGGLPYVDARLNPAAPTLRIVLDTGDNGTFSIPYDTYQHDQSLFAPLHNVKTYGLGGRADAVAGELPAATIGTVSFDHADIRAVRGTTAGHIGYALAARCGRLALDYGQQRIDCLKP